MFRKKYPDAASQSANRVFTAAIDLSIDELLGAGSDRRWAPLRVTSAGEMHGEYPSRKRGSGFELDSISPYQPGDDIRRMDWRATARTGRPQVRRFDRPVQRDLLLLVDLRSKMYFGTREQLMAKTACLVAARQCQRHALQQKVGWLLLSDEGLLLLPFERGRKARLRQLYRLAAHYRAQLPGGVAASVEETERIEMAAAHSNADAILISDFSDVEGRFREAVQSLGPIRKTAVIIDDPMITEAPLSGHYPVLSEGVKAPVVYSIDRSVSSRYADAARAADKRLKTSLLDRGFLSIYRCAGVSLTREC